MLYETKWGTITFGHNQGIVNRVILPDKQEETGLEEELSSYQNQKLTALERELNLYFQGRLVNFSIPVSLEGLPTFTKQVLEVTKRVNWGEVCTYGQIAKILNKPGASRAVGQSLGKNPCPLLVPCHRVIGRNNSLGGFSGMIELKKWFLNLEGVNLKVLKEV